MRGLWSLIGVGLALAPGWACARALDPTPDAGPPAQAEPALPLKLTLRDWRWIPNEEEMRRAYPRDAKKRGVQGMATMSCRVTEDGRLDACAVVEERPEGEGFGAAALKLAPRFRLPAKLSSGEKVGGGTVRIPLYFHFGREPL